MKSTLWNHFIYSFIYNAKLIMTMSEIISLFGWNSRSKFTKTSNAFIGQFNPPVCFKMMDNFSRLKNYYKIDIYKLIWMKVNKVWRTCLDINCSSWPPLSAILFEHNGRLKTSNPIKNCTFVPIWLKFVCTYSTYQGHNYVSC